MTETTIMLLLAYGAGLASRWLWTKLRWWWMLYRPARCQRCGKPKHTPPGAAPDANRT